MAAAEGEEKARLCAEMSDEVADIARENGIECETCDTTEEFLGTIENETTRAAVEQSIANGGFVPGMEIGGVVRVNSEHIRAIGGESAADVLIGTMEHESAHADAVNDEQARENVARLAEAMRNDAVLLQEGLRLIEAVSGSDFYTNEANRMRADGQGLAQMVADEVVAHGVQEMALERDIERKTTNNELLTAIQNGYERRQAIKQERVRARGTEGRTVEDNGVSAEGNLREGSGAGGQGGDNLRGGAGEGEVGVAVQPRTRAERKVAQQQKIEAFRKNVADGWIKNVGAASDKELIDRYNYLYSLVKEAEADDNFDLPVTFENGGAIPQISAIMLELKKRGINIDDVLQSRNNDEKARYRFVGEKGAENADKAEGSTVRMDNLKVAEEMEKEYKDLQGSDEHKKMVEASKRVKELKAIPVEAHSMNRDEQKAKYEGFDNATNNETGVTAKFFGTGFKKNHRDGGLFEKAIPKLKEAFETAVFAYSEEDKLSGTQRRDGSTHKEHRSITSFDNYINKLRIDNQDYYIRFTVQRQPNADGLHSSFITNVELYENPAAVASGKSSNGQSRLDYNRIVDAKLRNFFNLASETEGEFAKKMKLATGWERGTDGKWRYEESDMLDGVKASDIKDIGAYFLENGTRIFDTLGLEKII